MGAAGEPLVSTGPDLISRRWLLRFEPREVEQRYARQRLGEEVVGTRALIGVAAVVDVALAWNDFALFGPSAQLAALLLARGALVATACALIYWIGTDAARARTDWALRAIGAWATALALQNLYAALTRPPDFGAPEAVALVQLMAYYVFLPLGFVSRIFPALLLSGCLIALVTWLRPPSRSNEPPVLVGLTLATNLVGLIGSRSLDRARRQQFLALEREQALREALAEALLKTLRGVVEICAHCKQVRDETGKWVRVEAYVRDRSYADFSHAICPQCLRTNFPEVS
jgi:hypothetical protein